MPYKKIHKDLRVAIGYILLAPELESKITSFDKLITPLTFLSGGTGGEDFLQTIDNSLFQNAFQDNNRDKVHITAYSDLMMGNNEYDEQEGEAHFLFVCNGEKADRGGGFMKSVVSRRTQQASHSQSKMPSITTVMAMKVQSETAQVF